MIILTLWKYPVATKDAGSGRSTGIGKEDLAVPPFPNCPKTLEPKEKTDPSAQRTRLWPCPPQTWTATYNII